MYKDEFLCKVSMNYLYLNTCLKMATLQNDLIQSAVQFVHCSQFLASVLCAIPDFSTCITLECNQCQSSNLHENDF